MNQIVECVPNFSEGRRQAVIDRIVAAMQVTQGAQVLDVQSDPDHNRSVVTVIGTPEAVVERYYPGVPALLRELGIDIPPVLYYFSHEKARTRLGFRSQHELGDVARLYREWRDNS